jgi:hypothetical protein
MTLAARTFRAAPDQGLIETRSLQTPSVPIFMRFYEKQDGTIYQLWRGLYNGRLIAEWFVPWCLNAGR